MDSALELYHCGLQIILTGTGRIELGLKNIWKGVPLPRPFVKEN